MGCFSSKSNPPLDGGITVTSDKNAALSSNAPECKFKLLLIGNAFAGKSSLLMRFADHNFPTEYMNTIGIDYKTTTFEVQGKKIKLQMWDTAGQERFRNITSSYYRGAHGILLVYDTTDEKSFKDTQGWLEEIRMYSKPDVQVLLVGNKIDLEHKRAVQCVEAQEFAAQVDTKHVEVSALTGENVEDAFRTLAEAILEGQSSTAAPVAAAADF